MEFESCSVMYAGAMCKNDVILKKKELNAALQEANARIEDMEIVVVCHST